MKGSAYTLIYAAALGTVCALVLTFAASFTAPYQQANREAEEAKNILVALNVPIPEKTPAKELLILRDEKVQEIKRGEVTTYVYSPGGANAKPEAVAIRFAGRGLWAPIKGYLAMDPGLTKIRGITFYEQEETPGLGGEIVKDWFRQTFIDLAIRGADGKPGIIIGTGEDAPNRVDGISGATMTCNKVQQMLNEAIKSIVKEK
ncbi:MAG: FMN-binding protein [Sedimentisphaerales bacterium]|nr:FMN-binding protein [Sedimentisphaerales bacterium]